MPEENYALISVWTIARDLRPRKWPIVKPRMRDGIIIVLHTSAVVWQSRLTKRRSLLFCHVCLSLSTRGLLENRKKTFFDYGRLCAVIFHSLRFSICSTLTRGSSFGFSSTGSAAVLVTDSK